ncbi:hypothetical protein LO772_08050 [Yinghuangia sp. ASG 101]|uniref:hypothetical protein n=1 Tax=Yinghuangia sp. ASG 101 TaxID=2896848 RepID=UPI001E383515|nr:hypothetical protein [Yinghuangia sp. ASG 101]UGQ13546.1 hypothetical protein LO772_08050 [Yinghuangia sp. ASG 101]
MTEMPPSRAMIAVDVQKYTGNPGASLPAVRQAVREIVPSALHRVGVSWDDDVERCDDAGDGLIVIVRDDHTHRLVDAVHYLNRELRRRRRDFDGPPLRLRAAVHHGPIDPVEGSGTAKNELCRMLDADELRQALAQTASYVALAVSDHVLRTAVRDRFTETVEEADFHRIDTEVKGMVLPSWVHVPANDWKPGAAPAAPGEPRQRTETPAPARDPQPIGGIRIGTVHGSAVTGGTVNGGVHSTVTSDTVHGHKGDNVYGDKTVEGA